MQEWFNKFLSKTVVKLSEWYERSIHYQCSSLVTMGDASKFYKQSSVFNFQNDRSKIRIGNNTHIRGELIVFPYGGDIQIGDVCYLSEGVRVWSGEKIVLGNHVAIAHNVTLADFAHETDYLERAAGMKNILTKGHPTEKGNIPTAPIIIEDYVAIYPNASILRGVRIGEGSVIATGSVVLNDVPPHTLMLGNPARPMKNLKNLTEANQRPITV